MAPPRSSSNTEWPASASSPADCQLLLKRSFFMQGVAVGQCRQRCLQGWPFLWIGTGGTVQQTLQRLFFTLPAHGTR
jgi:hypothetical protein